MKTEIAFLAGFLEGDGSFIWTNGTPAVKATQVTREPLDRLRREFGGPAPKRRPQFGFGRQPIYQWEVYGERARHVARVVYSVMTKRRQRQMRRVFGASFFTHV